MSKQREALKMALDWIEAQPEPRMTMAAKTMRTIREALAEPIDPVKEAAHDLLEALELLLDQDKHGDDEVWVRVKARQAIRKARGE